MFAHGHGEATPITTFELNRFSCCIASCHRHQLTDKPPWQTHSFLIKQRKQPRLHRSSRSPVALAGAHHHHHRHCHHHHHHHHVHLRSPRIASVTSLPRSLAGRVEISARLTPSTSTSTSTYAPTLRTYDPHMLAEVASTAYAYAAII